MNNHIATPDRICVEWIYEQPYSSVFGMSNLDVSQINYTPMTIRSSFRAEIGSVWKVDDPDLLTWKRLAKRILKRNECFENYVVKDKHNNHIIPNEMLGVIYRRTDYVKLRPKMHPVQPDFDEVIEKTRCIMNDYGVSSVYVATDEERFYNRMVEEFGKDNVFTITREYYDEMY